MFIEVGDDIKVFVLRHGGCLSLKGCGSVVVFKVTVIIERRLKGF